MSNSDVVEVSLRQAIGHINTAKGYIERLDYQVTLDDAYMELETAIDNIRDWAGRHGVTIRESMRT
jgi:hypothetical protein